MSGEPGDRIPLALVTGFLGSGKTTLLQEFVRRQRDRRLLYLVNEFGSVDIDGRRLALPPDRLVTIPGGSIFCRCLVTEFIGHLRRIADGDGARLDGVVIEASGIANPKVIADLLRETGLDARYRLASVIAVVDPATLADLLETLPNIAAQVEAAGVAVLNKIDLVDEAELTAAAARLREINPALRILRAEHCRVALDPFALEPPAGLTGTYALCTDPNYGQIRFFPARDLRSERIGAALQRLTRLAFRLKGFARVDGALCHVDVSRSGVRVEPAGAAADGADGGPPSELVCIFPPARRDDVRNVLMALQDAPASA